jgi:prepilin-type N-terminal cleavage/methylation domain-containing protein/prepilin-type processing-associated H-X9-DG protein
MKSASSLTRNKPRSGFTLIELLTGLAVTSVLLSLLFVGVQSARGMARRIACANNLRQQAVALTAFSSVHQHFPAGRQYRRGLEYSWCLEALPYLDQAPPFKHFDPAKPWSDPAGNVAIAETSLASFRCPGGPRKFAGETDYAGILGSLLPGSWIPGTEMANGVMVEVGAMRLAPLRPAEITDGLSQTIAIAECTDRLADRGGRWISGFNCLSHDSGRINDEPGSDIFSLHAGGSNLAFADGRVKFTASSTAPSVIGALCTRSGGETPAPR